MTAAFQLPGQDFIALNGGPHFKFTEAISFVVNCESQEEIDYSRNKLSEPMPGHNNADGSKTNLVCRGKLFQRFCQICLYKKIRRKQAGNAGGITNEKD